MADHERHFNIFTSFDPVNDGSMLREWPRHIDLVPPFDVDLGEEAAALDAIRLAASDTAAFRVHEGRHIRIGAGFEMPIVEIVDANGELGRLHTNLMFELGAAGARFAHMDGTLEEYIPHATVADGAYPSFPHDVDSLTIGSVLSDEYQANKIIYRSIKLRK